MGILYTVTFRPVKFILSTMATTDTNNPKLLLRVSEAAELLSVARSKAYLMVQTGELPSVRLGKSVRIPVAALNAYVERITSEAAHA